MEEKDFEKQNFENTENKEQKIKLPKNKLFAQEIEEEKIEDVTAVTNPTIQPTERKGKKKNKIKKQRTAADKIGVLFVVLSLICLLVGFLPLGVALVYAVYAVILITIAALTLFLILLNKEFQERFQMKDNAIINFVFDVIAPISKYLFLGSAVFAGLAVVMFSVSKTKYDKVGKIVLCSILTLISIALSILVFSGTISTIS